MKRGPKKFLKACAFVAGGMILLAAAAVMMVLLDKPLVKKAAERYLVKKTGIALTVGKLDYRLFPLSVEASSVNLSYATPAYSFEVAVDRIGLKGDFVKLLKGERAALETVDADISEVRVNQTMTSPEPIDFQGLLLQMANILNASHRASLRCGRLIFLFLSQDFRLDDAALTITQGRSEGVLDITLSCDKIAGVVNGGRSSFGSGLDVDGSLSLGGTAGVNLRVALVKPQIDLAGKAAAVDNMTLDIHGTWQPDKGILRFPALALHVPGLASFTGKLDVLSAGIPSIDAEAKATIINLEALDQVAASFLPAAFRPVRFRGSAGLEGKYSLSPGPEGKTGRLAVLMRTEGIEWEYQRGPLPLRGKISGMVKAEGPPADPRISGDLSFGFGKLSGMGAAIRSASGNVRIAGSKAAAEIIVPSAALRGVSIAVSRGKGLAFEWIAISGKAGVRLGDRPDVEADLAMRLPGLAPVRLVGRVGLAPLQVYQASLVSPGQRIPALRALLTPFLPKTLSGWAADGKADISVNADGLNRTKRRIRLRADIAISGGKFNDPDFTVASDNLQSLISIQGDYVLGAREFAATGTIEILRGESLWQRFYISWDKSPLKAGFSARFDPAARSLEGLVGRVAVPGIGEFGASGRLGLAMPLAFDIQVHSRFALEPALSIFSESKPLSQGRPQIGGEAATDFEIRKSGSGLTLKGRLTFRDVSVVIPASGFSIPALSADLPLDLVLSGTPAPPPAGMVRESGVIRLGKIRASGFEVDVPPLSLSSSPNAYEIASFFLEIFGGRLEFGRSSLAVKAGPLSLQGASSLRLTDIDLSRLPFAPALSTLKGTMRADFPGLGITHKEVRTSGRAEADVFGGRVVIRDLAVLDPFARDREISCDIDLLDLDLKGITELVPFGEVTGIISGEIRDLIIAYGQPEQFSLILESVERKDVPRTFSLKAVNSLTVITSGQEATPGTSSFWLRFIKGFRYDKIGIRSSLKNDTFTIDGTIKENGVEYLVKRPPLSGISVINRNPGKSIGFKDMMSRLKRVGQSGAPETK